MKGILRFIMAGLVLMIFCFSCTELDYKGTGPVDYSVMLEKMSEMQDLLDNSEFGTVDGTYPIAAGEALSKALDGM